MMINRTPIVSPQALQSAIIRDFLVISPETPIEEAIIKLTGQSPYARIAKHEQDNRQLELGSSCLVTLAEGRRVGLVTDKELLRISHQEEELQRRQIAEVSSAPVMTLQHSQVTDLLSIINLFQQPNLHHLPILDEQNQFVGLVTPESLIKVTKPVAFWEKWTVERVMKSDIPIATAETTLDQITEQMITTDPEVIVIVNRDAIPQGLITAKDLLQQQGLGFNPQQHLAQDLLTSPPVTVQPQDSLLKVAEIMLEYQIAQVVVTGKRGEELGLVSARELIETLHPQALYRLAETLNQQLDQEVSSCQSQLQIQRQQQKQTKIALEFSNNRFRGIFENTFQFIGLLSPDGVLLEANQTALNAAGIKREDAVGRPFWETPWWQISDSAQVELRNAITRAAQGEFIRYEVEVLGANQTMIPIDFSLRPIQDDQGAVILLIPEGRDLTEAKRLEVERQQTVNLLQASKRRYASLVKASPVGIFRCDTVGNCIYTNQVACKILGLSSEQMKGKGWQQALHPDDRAQVITEWREAITENRSFQMEYRFLRPDGSVKWVYGQSAIERDRNQQVHGYIGTITDISDRKEAELERQWANNRLQELNEQLEAKVEERTATLRKREAELQDFFDNAHDLIQSVCLTTGKFEYVNRSWRKVLGYSLEEVARLTLFDVLHPDCHDHCREVLTEMRNGRLTQVEQIEVIFLSKAGQEIILEGGINCRWEGEQPIATRAIFRDITQRKRTEQEIRLLQERLQYLLNSNPAMIYSCQPHGNYDATFMSENVVNILGYQPQDFTEIENFWANHIHPEDQDEVLAGVSQLWEVDDYKQEYRFLHSQGYYIWMRDECRLVRDEAGNPVEIIGYFADITEQKQTEQAIRESQEFLKSVLTVFPLYLFWKNTESVYLGCNENFAIAAGVSSPEEIIGKTDYDLPWTEAQTDAYLADDQEVIISGTPKLGYLETQRQANGQQIWVETSKVPLYDGNGEIIGVLGTYQDITARKEAEEQLQRTNEALIRATQLKDEFLANMSHELRTPLNAILGMTEGLQEKVYGQINEKQAKALKTIQTSGSHLLELINDILDLSKIESGQMELRCAETEISNLCQSAFVFIQQQAYKKRIQFSAQLPTQLPSLFVDERRIRQVLINLLTNAVKFTPEGGQITLEVNYSATSEPEKPSAEDYIRFTVCDTGIGIAAENFQRLFQPFIQIDSSLNRRYEGTGLGLSLVKRIVELHGGDVGVRSEVGVGSCFYFDLPLACAIAPPESLSMQSEVNGETSSSLTEEMPLILLAEDNEANVMTLTSYLEAKGYRLLVASNGEEAIQLANTNAPDVVVMDIQMPDLDGLEAIQQIRSASEIPNVPIIALTAFAMEGDRDRCLEAGADGYLSKPVRLRELVKLIEQQLGSFKLP
ncbi:multi-sensor hybrid histidine kinase [Halothece sp. PCC 7418]|uniref:PAS domain S-box protein n=1 Tax=Halothece sp. (strain PCC 7418) TaxID=65093 RepID=UPI0002A07A1E|nr:PAS domain S-box protein [Halothece sp. PCC 7418]AFZ43901.1 multi-sensor hybrid histidine kinase [Halothece sp. PCC 7418]